MVICDSLNLKKMQISFKSVNSVKKIRLIIFIGDHLKCPIGPIIFGLANSAKKALPGTKHHVVFRSAYFNSKLLQRYDNKIHALMGGCNFYQNLNVEIKMQLQIKYVVDNRIKLIYLQSTAAIDNKRSCHK